MPQIVLKKTESITDVALSMELTLELGKKLINTVEVCFDIKGENDTAFTSQVIECVINEKNVQIEVRYTAGEDEYGKGKPFDPSERDQRRVNRKIKETFKRFLRKHKLPDLSLSTHCKAYGKSVHCSVYQEWD